MKVRELGLAVCLHTDLIMHARMQLTPNLLDLSLTDQSRAN